MTKTSSELEQSIETLHRDVRSNPWLQDKNVADYLLISIEIMRDLLHHVHDLETHVHWKDGMQTSLPIKQGEAP